MPKRQRLSDESAGEHQVQEERCLDEIPNEKENCSTGFQSAMGALHQTHLSFSRACLKVKNRMDELGAAYEENTNEMGEEIIALDNEMECFWEFYVKLLERKNELKEAWEKHRSNKRVRRSLNGEVSNIADEQEGARKVVPKELITGGSTQSMFLSPMKSPRHRLTSPMSSKSNPPYLKDEEDETQAPNTSQNGSSTPHLNSPNDNYHRHQFNTPSLSYATTHASPESISTPAPTPQKLAAQGIKNILDGKIEIIESNTPSKAIVVAQSSGPKCVPKPSPVPARFMGDMDKFKDLELPEFRTLCNYAEAQFANIDLPKDMRFCVMCGHACPCSTGHKVKSKKKSNAGDAPVIPTQNKGLCTLCDVNVWVVVESKLEIKWCKGCKNFKPWAAFGWKGSGTKCAPCRERLREMYARSKERSQQKILQATQQKAICDGK
eukprot:CAMPEP_0172465842 /NCGR_PEP_ID=MMETSP1065-20121228/54638_1 /TAXON_ID=265537 /ORGANISM="Amphiprora paludosa, Strain CCMP125" /LENGTH=435 /DNA_ID=CAMNT_0013222491 /DNA_START=102 /DNA_END=1409 /DNA_ORIENTATION=+